MTLSDAEVERIVSAVETVEESLAVLSDKQSLSRTAYRNDRETQDVVERRFVKLTEATLDIAMTVLRHEHGIRSESNPAAMIALREAGVLDSDTARKMAEARRARSGLSAPKSPVCDGVEPPLNGMRVLSFDGRVEE